MDNACALCGSDRPLRNSHIVPEFVYKPAYDDKHRALELSRMTGGKKFLQKGHREPLLCEECEQHIGRYEKYFKEVWYDGGKLPNRVSDDPHWVRGLDYSRFKLFHLSVLWRAGVSKSSMFRHVNLGTHVDRIRTMILADQPGRADEYQFVAQVLVNDGKVVDGFVMEPAMFKHDNRHHHVFLFAGCAWNYIVSNRPVTGLMPLALTVSGDLPMLRQQITQHDLIRDFLVDHHLSAAEE